MVRLLEELINQGESCENRKIPIFLGRLSLPGQEGRKRGAQVSTHSTPGNVQARYRPDTSPHLYLPPFPPQALTQLGEQVRTWALEFDKCWVQILTPPLTTCATLNKSYHLSGPWLPHLENGDNSSCLRVLL